MPPEAMRLWQRRHNGGLEDTPVSHLDDAQLDAYLAGRGEFTDRASRREAGRHIADCAECSGRLKHAWAGHPESIDHPVGPAGRPSWPLLRVSGRVSRPAVPPRGNGHARGKASPAQVQRAIERPVPPTRETPRAQPIAVAADGDALSGSPWPDLIAALEAVLRPKAAEPPPSRPIRRTPGGGWFVDQPAPEFGDHGLPEAELVDHSADVPALDLDLTRRYQSRAEQSRRRSRRRHVMAAAAMLILAVLLAGAVLKVGAATLSTSQSWRTPAEVFVTPAEVPSTTLFESAAALQAFAESLRATGDSTDSISTIVASVLHPDVRQAINDSTWGDAARVTSPDPTAPSVAQPSRRSPPTSGTSPSAEPSSAGPRLPATRRASSLDTALTTGEWRETGAAAAERQLRHPLLFVSGLGLESIATPGTSGGSFVRIAQVTRGGDRVAIVLSRTASPAGAPPAPPGLGSIRVLPATGTNATAMAMGRWGDVLVTVRADLPADSLRAFMQRLREARD